VWEHCQAGTIEGIRKYCETDALNTYLVYQRFELIRGHSSAAQVAQACEQLSTKLEKAYKPHLCDLLQHWQGSLQRDGTWN
jgi:predicted PolB exonuclease-like 3'-5' exonuclease